MSETQEREQEIVAGVIEGITQKRADTWQVAVKPEGSQYAKKLWTKSASTIEALTKIIGEHRAFVCNASYWKNNSGTQVRSLWIEDVSEDVGTEPSPGSTPSAPATPAKASGAPKKDELTKEQWRAKDSAADLRACIAIAAGALEAPGADGRTIEQLNVYNAHVLHLATSWHRVVSAERDGEDIPF